MKSAKLLTGGPPARSRWALGAGLALALLVLAATIVGSVLHLRARVRAQIASRDGEILEAVASSQYLDDEASGDTIATLEDPGEQMDLVMKISQLRLRDVLGVRLFSAKGEFVNAAPAYITETSLSPDDLAALRALRPVSHFLPRARLEEQDLLAQTNAVTTPLIEVNIPLHEEGRTGLAGVAQFVMNGTSIASKYAQLDRDLLGQGALAFAIGGTILAAGLALAFRRVQRANRMLAERTANLLKANRELALAAKTSAVGALASHLIHGLKNPLSGLQSFVQDGALGNGHADDTDWQLAIATTRRMETLINRVVRVLQEQPTTAEYEVSLTELKEMLTAKLAPIAAAAGVKLETAVAGASVVSSREADLLLLILENLVQNALEATPPGKTVRLTLLEETERLVMEVVDEGPGLSAGLLGRLFTPCPSDKKGGSGIGLAISRQLANHLGGELELKHSSSHGCVFCLTLPLAKLGKESDFEPAAAAMSHSTGN